MVLSIGMIVKNEEKYLEQCLTALQPLLDAVDSELIIADTGSTDRTVEIAKKFTDNVFHFEWINDFAAARNSTFDRAQGEWYMFIDADEIAQDCSGIIKFFKNGEYMRYQSATYLIRSLGTEGADNAYLDFHANRLTRRNGVTRFVHAIHEGLYPFMEPVKKLDFSVRHYGYVYAKQDGTPTDLAHKKVQRNLEMLFDELDNPPSTGVNQLVYDQIADCYDVIGEIDNSLKYLNIGLKEISHESYPIIAYYTHKLKILVLKEDFNGIIDLAHEYFDKTVNPFHTKDFANDCYIRAWEGYSQYKKHLYADAVDTLAEFIRLYSRYKNGRLETYDLTLGPFRLEQTTIQADYDIFFRCCYHEKKFGLANEYARAIHLKDYFGNESFMRNHINIRMEIMENIGYNGWNSLYKELDDFGKGHLLSRTRSKLFTTSPEKRTFLLKKMDSVGGIGAELAEFYTGYFNGKTDFEMITALLEKYGSENSEDMLYILLEKQADITPFLLTHDFFADRAVQMLLGNYPGADDLLERYNINVISNEGLLNAVSVYGWVMLRFAEHNRTVSKVFEMYGQLGMMWRKAFSDESDIPGDIRAATMVYNVAVERAKGDYALFKAAIKKLTNNVRDISLVAETYERENRSKFKARYLNPEMQMLADQAKQNIRNLISDGHLVAAQSLVDELEGISPCDPEISELHEEIEKQSAL